MENTLTVVRNRSFSCDYLRCKPKGYVDMDTLLKSTAGVAAIKQILFASDRPVRVLTTIIASQTRTI